MKIQDLLAELDASTDSVQRLIVADWLAEQGCQLEAAFYRWVVAHNLNPWNPSYQQFEWSNHKTHNPPAWAENRNVIVDIKLWQQLRLCEMGIKLPQATNVSLQWIVYESRAFAFAALRQAYCQGSYPGDANRSSP